MNDPLPSPPSKSPPRLWVSCALLALAFAIAWCAVAAFAYHRDGAAGLLAASIAAAVTLFGAEAALVSGALVHGAQAAVVRMLCGMAFRMGLPLVAGLALDKISRLNEVGIVPMILVFYFVSLTVETPLSLRFIPRSTAVPHSPGTPIKTA